MHNTSFCLAQVLLHRKCKNKQIVSHLPEELNLDLETTDFPAAAVGSIVDEDGNTEDFIDAWTKLLVSTVEGFCWVVEVTAWKLQDKKEVMSECLCATHCMHNKNNNPWQMWEHIMYASKPKVDEKHLYSFYTI